MPHCFYPNTAAASWPCLDFQKKQRIKEKSVTMHEDDHTMHQMFLTTDSWEKVFLEIVCVIKTSFTVI